MSRVMSAKTEIICTYNKISKHIKPFIKILSKIYILCLTGKFSKSVLKHLSEIYLLLLECIIYEEKHSITFSKVEKTESGFDNPEAETGGKEKKPSHMEIRNNFQNKVLIFSLIFILIF